MKLQISEPVITSHHYYALPLSIIGSEPRLISWVYSEFIQIYTCRNREDEKVDIRLYNKDNEMFKYEPLYDAIIAPRRLVYGEQIVEVYKALLNSGQYIYDFVDKYYIRAFNFNDHVIHDLLVYGYDDNAQMLCAYAYCRNKLKEFLIPYSEYIAAYNSEYMQTRHHITVLYRKKEGEYRVNIRQIGTYLLDYLNGVNTYSRESLQKVCLYKPKFGLKIYDELKYMLEYDLEHHFRMDIPDIFCLYNHKQFMCKRVVNLDRISPLKCPSDLYEQFRLVEQFGNILAMLALKLNQTNLQGRSNINAFMKRLDSLRDAEEKAYSKYYEFNRSVFENN